MKQSLSYDYNGSSRAEGIKRSGRCFFCCCGCCWYVLRKWSHSTTASNNAVVDQMRDKDRENNDQNKPQSTDAPSILHTCVKYTRSVKSNRHCEIWYPCCNGRRKPASPNSMRSTESRACNQCPQSKHPEFLVKSQSMNIIQFRYTASAYVLSNPHILLVLSLPPGSHPRNILTLTRDRRSHSQLAKVNVDDKFWFVRSHSRG